MNFIKHTTFQKPVLTGIILMLIALSFRLIDIFVLRLDERLGEIILSKALGFCLVLGFVWMIFSSFILRYPVIGGGLWNDIIVGVIVVILGVWAARTSPRVTG